VIGKDAAQHLAPADAAFGAAAELGAVLRTRALARAE